MHVGFELSPVLNIGIDIVVVLEALDAVLAELLLYLIYDSVVFRSLADNGF